MQLRFVHEYLKMRRPNGTKAAIAAGYSPKNAAWQGSTLLSNPNVAKHLEANIDRYFGNSKAEVYRNAQILAAIRDADVPDVLTNEGAMLPFDEWPEEARIALHSLDMEEEIIETENEDVTMKRRTKKLRFMNKIDAIKELNRIHQITDRPSNQSVTNNTINFAAVNALYNDLCEGE